MLWQFTLLIYKNVNNWNIFTIKTIFCRKCLILMFEHHMMIQVKTSGASLKVKKVSSVGRYKLISLC